MFKGVARPEMAMLDSTEVLAIITPSFERPERKKKRSYSRYMKTSSFLLEHFNHQTSYLASREKTNRGERNPMPALQLPNRTTKPCPECSSWTDRDHASLLVFWPSFLVPSAAAWHAVAV